MAEIKTRDATKKELDRALKSLGDQKLAVRGIEVHRGFYKILVASPLATTCERDPAAKIPLVEDF